MCEPVLLKNRCSYTEIDENDFWGRVKYTIFDPQGKNVGCLYQEGADFYDGRVYNESYYRLSKEIIIKTRSRLGLGEILI